MRAKILQYNGNDGTGTLTAEGQQHKFAIAVWKADQAPVVGKTVDVVFVAGELQSVTPVAEDVLLREKTAELTGKLGGLMGGMGGTLSKGGAAGVGGSLVARFGKQVLIAYVVFAISTLFIPAINMPMVGGEPMFNLAGIVASMGGGGGMKLLLILAYLGVALPIFWPDRRAWLALLVPLLAVLWGFITAKRAVGGMGGGSLGDVIGVLGVGFYLALISAIVLGLAGFKRYRTAS